MMAENVRPAVRDLTKMLAFRATFGRPCFVKRTPAWAALIVPHLTDGEVGPYSYLRTYRRATLDDAVQAGLVVLGGELVDVPPIGGRHWSAQPEVKGRTIALAEVETHTRP